MEHDRVQEIETGRARCRVTPSTAADAPGGVRSVVFCVDVERCPMRLQDYFTPDEADKLADALREVATDARRLAAHPDRTHRKPAGTVCS